MSKNKSTNLDHLKKFRSSQHGGYVYSSQKNFLDYELDLTAAINAVYTDSQSYIDINIAPTRNRVMRAFLGYNMGNEIPGRAQGQCTDVRDTMYKVLPSLLRIFTQSDKIVDFDAKKASDAAMAEDATKLVNYTFWHDNEGYELLRNAFFDACLLKNGIMKVWYEDIPFVKPEYFQNMSELEINDLLNDPEGDEIEIVEKEKANSMFSDQFNITIKRTRKEGRVVIETLPPEEWLIYRLARSSNEKDCQYCAHRKIRSMSEMVGLGYDEDLLQDYVTTDENFIGMMGAVEEVIRNPFAFAFLGSISTQNPAMQKLKIVEHYIQFDSDDDGIAELHKVISVGDTPIILSDEIVDDHPFCVFESEPMPHLPIGRSIGEDALPTQYLKTGVLRDMLDGLSQSIHPRTVANLNELKNVDDLLNLEIGSVIRTKSSDPNAVRILETPFEGQESLAVMNYLDEQLASRTGITPASQGLDPDVLQSTTASAVHATVAGAQERIEYIARNLANSTKRLGQLILKETIRHQNKPRNLKISGDYVTFDPKDWDVNMHVNTAVALGRGATMQQIQTLMAVAGKQEQIMAQGGLTNNPMVDLHMYSDTLSQMLSLQGFKNTEAYFKKVPANYKPPQTPPPPPSPQMMTVQLEQQKQQVWAQVEATKMKLEAMKIKLEHERLTAKQNLDFEASCIAAYLKNTGQSHEANINALVDFINNKSTIQAQHQQELISMGLDHVQTLNQQNNNMQNNQQQNVLQHIQAMNPQTPQVPPGNPQVTPGNPNGQ
jgi:hypothetical protein